jgi:hypothetical protein
MNRHSIIPIPIPHHSFTSPFIHHIDAYTCHSIPIPFSLSTHCLLSTLSPVHSHSFTHSLTHLPAAVIPLPLLHCTHSLFPLRCYFPQHRAFLAKSIKKIFFSFFADLLKCWTVNQHRAANYVEASYDLNGRCTVSHSTTVRSHLIRSLVFD